MSETLKKLCAGNSSFNSSTNLIRLLCNCDCNSYTADNFLL